MSKRVISSLGLLLLTASVCAVLPTRGQNRNQQPVDLPEGDGKADGANRLRNLPRADAGDERGTRPRRLGDGPAHDGQRRSAGDGRPVRHGAGLPDQEFPAQATAGSADYSRQRGRYDQGVGGADAGIAAARSDAGAGWVGLVFGADCQRAGTFRSEDRTVQGVQAAAEVRATRAAGGQGRQHLVHREFRGLYRQARSQDRRGDEISHAGPESARPAYAASWMAMGIFFSRCRAATWWDGWT